MGKDLFAGEGKDLFAGEPVGKDLFAGEPVGRDLFAEEAPNGPSFLDHMGDLLKNSPMIGTIQPDMVPSNVGTQLAVGATMSLQNAPETYFRERMLDEDHRNTPENQARLQELRMDRAVAGQVLREAQAGDNAVAKLVGDAAQSLPGSAASLVPGALPLKMGAALASGLGINYAVETASDYTHRTQDLGQAPDAAEVSANLHGGVATALEAAPAGAVLKYVRGGATLGRTAVKVGAGEALQEGGTQAFDDTLTNLEGLTNLTPEQRLENAGKAALTGAIMAPMMGPGAKVVQMGRAYGEQVRAEKAQAAQAEEATAALAEMQRRAEEATRTALGMPEVDEVQQELPPLTRVVQTPQGPTEVPFVPTAEDEVQAELQLRQVRDGLDVEAGPAGQAYGALLTRELHQGQEVAALEDALALDEGGVSRAVEARRMYDRGLDNIPTADKPIVLSTDQSVLGLTLTQTGAPPEGTVTAVGRLGENFPREVFEPAMATFTQFVQEYLPRARVVVDFSRLPQDAFGKYNAVEHEDGSWTHVISPMDMLNYGRHGVSDPKTAMSLVTAISHEFGHALVTQALPEGLEGKLAPELIRELGKQARTGKVTQKLLTVLKKSAPVEGALVEHWMQTRARVLDGTLTAQEFVDEWAGTRKLGYGILREKSRQSLYRWAAERLSGNPDNPAALEGKTALEMLLAPLERANASAKDKQAFLNSYLSLHEFMAEQFSKYAYSKGDLERSGLGQLFAPTMARLRELFRRLKSWTGASGEKIIAPNTTFEQWMEGVVYRAQETGYNPQGFKLEPKIVKAQKKLMKEAKKQKLVKEVEEALAEPESPPEQVAPSKQERGSQRGRKEKLDKTIDLYEEYGWFKSQKGVQRARDMLERGQLKELEMLLEKMAGDTSQYDREYTTKVLERLPKENQKRLKAATLKSTIAMQDVKAVERANWERFLAEHPDGFTPQDLRLEMMMNTLPLEPVYSRKYADIGAHLTPGGYEAAPRARSVIWTTLADISSDNHFNKPSYVMHSRETDWAGTRYVLELQSDLFQKEDVRTLELGPTYEMQSLMNEAITDYETAELLLEEAQDEKALGTNRILVDEAYLKTLFGETPARKIVQTGDNELYIQELQRVLPEMKKKADEAEKLQEALNVHLSNTSTQLAELAPLWEERLIQEVVAQAAEDGVGMMRFPTAETLARIEGWDTVRDIEEMLDGYRQISEHYAKQLEGMPEGQERTALATKKRVVDLSIRGAEGRLRSWGESYVEPKFMGIFKRYKNTTAKYLKKKYGAMEVEEAGYTWLEFPLDDKSNVVQHWDRDNPVETPSPRWTVDAVAGLSPEQMRDPKVVAEAVELWERLGTESPFFKRWGGNSQVKAPVWRGTDSPVMFLDKTTRGGLTGVSSAKKAFWFSDNQANAAFYAGHGMQARRDVLKPEARRDAQQLRLAIEQMEEMLNQPIGYEKANTLGKMISRDKKALAALERNPENKMPSQPTIRLHYLNIVNPYVIDMRGEGYDNKTWTEVLDVALANGHDGVIMKNASDPFEGTIYAIFEPEQAKLESNIGTFDATDNLHWDRDSVNQQATRTASKLVQAGWGEVKLRWMNAWAKAADNLVQLQQVAAAQPGDATLASFMKTVKQAERLKNHLMGQAEDVTKELMSLTGSSYATRQTLYKLLQKEAKLGELQADLIGVSQDGTPTSDPVLVKYWEVTDGLKLRQYLQKEGIDPESVEGKRTIELYLKVRNVFMQQFAELGRALETKAIRAYASAPLMLKTERYKIKQLVFELSAKPFTPVAKFGNYVVSIKRGREVLSAKYFESKTDYDKAAQAAYALRRQDMSLRVYTKELGEDEKSLPLALPADLFERLAGLGEFTDAQLELMKSTMQVSRVDRIAEKFAQMTKQIEGREEDFARVFADFTWHNSNYIWKMRYRSRFQDVLAAGRHEVRELEKDLSLRPEETKVLVDRQRRNLALMEHQMNYMLTPPAEMQAVRGYISLAYLAFGVKTAVMNASTQMNTIAALTEEFGHGAGLKHYARAWKLFWPAYKIAQARREGERVELTERQQKAGLEPIAQILQKALEDGIIDQSFAYFLAGQANSAEFMRGLKMHLAGQLTQKTLELGMAPFQLMEKLNRIIALVSVFSAEMEENQKEGGWKSFNQMYDKAAKRVDQTQNAYDAANRAKILQGNKAIFTMFMSYSLFMGHVMTGGLHRAVQADIREENLRRGEMGREPKAVPGVLRNSTVKLWLMFLVLAGPLGLPFAENLMDLARWLWRKLWPKEELEVTIRNYLEELGLDANLVLHGVSHDVAGFNVSASLGLGRLVPGTALLGKNYQNASEVIGKQVVGLSGPAGSFYESVVRAVMELHEGNPVEAAKQLPGATGAVVKAIDAWVRQNNLPTYGVVAKDGSRLTFDAEKGEFRDVTTKELVGMAMGFNPTLLAENREVKFRVDAEKLYWQIRRSDVLDKYWQAISTRDPELRAEADQARRAFAEDVPYPEMQITGKDLRQSMKTRQKGVNVEERFGVKEKMYRRLGMGVKNAYTDGD